MQWLFRWLRRRREKQPPETPSLTFVYDPNWEFPKEEAEWLNEQFDKHGGLETLWVRKPEVLRQIREEYRKRFPPKSPASEPNDNSPAES